jgi:effector-binding domain-containing protein
MEHEVKVGQRQAALVMSKRVPVRLSEIGEVMGSAFGEVYGYLGTQGIEPAGEPFVIYHDMPEADLPFDIEVCAPIGRSTDETPQGWRVQELPAGTFATLVHVGPYDTIGNAYETMGSWIEAHGLEASGPPREVYLSPPETPPERIRTVVEFPVVEMVAPARTR